MDSSQCSVMFVHCRDGFNFMICIAVLSVAVTASVAFLLNRAKRQMVTYSGTGEKRQMCYILMVIMPPKSCKTNGFFQLLHN